MSFLPRIQIMRLGALMASVAGALVAAAPTANADPISPFEINLGQYNGQNGYSGMSAVTGIDHLNISGFATINQTVVAGNAVGNQFDETAIIGIGSMSTGALTLGITGPLNTALNSGSSAGAADMFFSISLHGTLTASGLSFSSGSAGLYLEKTAGQGNIANAADLKLADFVLSSPSGATGQFNFYGGQTGQGLIGLTFTQTDGAGLFADGNGNPLDLPFTLDQATANAALVKDDNSGVDANGNGTAKITVQNGGQFGLAVPEPTSLALFGAGLIGLGFVSHRRAKSSKKV